MKLCRLAFRAAQRRKLLLICRELALPALPVMLGLRGQLELPATPGLRAPLVFLAQPALVALLVRRVIPAPLGQPG